MFSTQEELKDKLMKMKFSSMGAYKKMVEKNWELINTPHTAGDFQVKSDWMENNLEVWDKVFTFNPYNKLETDGGEKDR